MPDGGTMLDTAGPQGMYGPAGANAMDIDGHQMGGGGGGMHPHMYGGPPGPPMMSGGGAKPHMRPGMPGPGFYPPPPNGPYEDRNMMMRGGNAPPGRGRGNVGRGGHMNHGGDRYVPS